MAIGNSNIVLILVITKNIIKMGLDRAIRENLDDYLGFKGIAMCYMIKAWLGAMNVYKMKEL